MAVLSENTVVTHPETGLPTSLAAGDQVPAWAVDQVGDHLVEGGDVSAETSYADQKNADLVAEIDRRNAEREESDRIVPEAANKAALVAALESDDARNAV